MNANEYLLTLTNVYAGLKFSGMVIGITRNFQRREEGMRKLKFVEPDNKPRTEGKARVRTPSVESKRFHTSVYLDPEFHQGIKDTLAEKGWSEDFNNLVNVLLRRWLKNPVAPVER
jgi:hypothetical protein